MQSLPGFKEWLQDIVYNLYSYGKEEIFKEILRDEDLCKKYADIYRSGEGIKITKII